MFSIRRTDYLKIVYLTIGIGSSVISKKRHRFGLELFENLGELLRSENPELGSCNLGRKEGGNVF